MDPIQMEVVYRATIQIAKELSLNMLRTGYSSVIKESQDFTFSILDKRGRMVAQGVPQPLHIGGISAQTQEVLRKFDGQMAPTRRSFRRCFLAANWRRWSAIQRISPTSGAKCPAPIHRMRRT
jgi:hypothetical protein